MMPTYNRESLDATLGRFRQIAPDAKPLWGSMTPPQMIAHIMTSVRYSLGKEEETPNEGGLLGRLVAPLILNGIIKMPKNAKGPAMYDAGPPEAELETFKAELEEFLERYESGTLESPPHPFFGDVKTAGWAKIHIVHCDHHLRQFGV